MFFSESCKVRGFCMKLREGTESDAPTHAQPWLDLPFRTPCTTKIGGNSQMAGVILFMTYCTVFILCSKGALTNYEEVNSSSFINWSEVLSAAEVLSREVFFSTFFFWSFYYGRFFSLQVYSLIYLAHSTYLCVLDLLCTTTDTFGVLLNVFDLTLRIRTDSESHWRKTGRCDFDQLIWKPWRRIPVGRSIHQSINQSSVNAHSAAQRIWPGWEKIQLNETFSW